MFTVRNYVVTGRKYSGGSPRLCPPAPSDSGSVFPVALNLWLVCPQRKMRSWDRPCLVTHRILTVMTCLNSSPFPDDEDVWCDPSLSPGLLNLGSTDRSFGAGVMEGGVHAQTVLCVCLIPLSWERKSTCYHQRMMT